MVSDALVRTRSQALELPPLTRALAHRAVLLGSAFRRIVFAQVRISALNTVLTALYLAVLLPMLGMPLPLTKTMIALTFVVGLLPVLGNLISNTVIVVVSLSVSLLTAISSLVFLIVILSAACGHNQRRRRSCPRQIDFKEMAAPTFGSYRVPG